MPAIDFNANEEPDNTGFDPLPPGDYKVVIENTEEKPTKKGDGSYIKFTFVVIDGQYERRKLWTMLNLNNPNDQAVGIARGELKNICLAVNVPNLKDTVQLHDIPLVVKVIAKPDKMTGEVRNEIKGYKPANGATTSKPQMAGAGAGASKAPWKK